MLEISDATMAAILAEFSPSAAEPMHGLDLEFLLHAAQHSGLLEELEVHHIFGADSRDDWFIVTVQVSPNIVLSSRVMRWHEVRPQLASGAEAIKHVLRRLGEVAHELTATFDAEALLRTAPELERVRELVREAETIDNGWAETSAKYCDARGLATKEELWRYDELRIGTALEAWKVSSAFSEIEGL
jgi:hypothetical protein